MHSLPIIGNIDGNMRIDRRGFLKAGALAAVAGAIPAPVQSAVGRLLSSDRSLSLFNAHTGENLHVLYCLRGRYRPEGLRKIDFILRDHRTGEVRPIDPRLLDLLHALSGKLRAQAPFHIISGFRSPETNAMLRRTSSNVAGGSLHMEGKAVDIRLPGCETVLLRRAAMEMRRGGVGFYPGPAFVHVDVGRVRSW